MTGAIKYGVKRPNKYGAKKTVVDGITFDSKKEAKRWGELCLLEKRGDIQVLERQIKFPLEGRDCAILTPTGRQMNYIADFVYMESGVRVIEDSKGVQTPEFKIKRAILAAQGIEIKVT